MQRQEESFQQQEKVKEKEDCNHGKFDGHAEGIIFKIFGLWKEKCYTRMVGKS